MLEKQWHSVSAGLAVEELSSNAEKGLSVGEAKKRLEEFGANRLLEKKRKPWVRVFLEQFNNFVVFVLIAAGLVSFAIWLFFGNNAEHLVDAFVIFLVVVVNAVLGFVQEYRAEKAMLALKKLSASKAIVVREGRKTEIDAALLVPGDIVLLLEGNRIPADCRIIEAVNLRVDEASLTGESVPASKHYKEVPETAVLADRRNMAFMNTVASYGRGKAVVVATGMLTEFGKIAGMIQEIKEEQTPLMQKLESLGAFLGRIVIAIAALMFVVGFFTTHFGLLELFLVSVSLAVAAIPEGLPAVVTITLALGMRAMAKNKAIMRKMSAVETLGSTSVICSDKTGTITKNEMTVTKAFVDGKELSVYGEGYSLMGKIKQGKEETKQYSRQMDLVLKTCVLCSTASIGKGAKKEVFGDATEIALLFFAGKAGYFKEETEKKARFVNEIPFDSERKRMSVVFEIEGKKIVLCKGSVESVLEASSYAIVGGKELPLSEKLHKELQEKNESMAKEGLRVLGFAFKELGRNEKENPEQDLVFLGMAGMIDAPREEVKQAIMLCKQAGISVKMVTGDHKLTAIAVAKQVGLLGEGQKAVTGKELDAMNDEQLEKEILEIAVFARVNPSHKVRIVKALEKHGATTAMTGDGVNDAPALKQADIGIAMGITGTDVSKEASEMIIQDDDFATIVKAVEEGRRVYSNIKSFVKYLLSANTAEVIVVGTAIALAPFGFPLPLIATQILWLNLVTDGLPALALGNEKADNDIMKKKPRPKKEKITDNIVSFMLAAGIVGAIVTLLGYFYGLGEGIEKARAMAFTVLVVFELLWVFNCRSETKDVFSLNPFSNKALLLAVLSSFALMLIVIYVPFLQSWFDTKPLSLLDWSVVALLSGTSLFIPRLVWIVKGKKMFQQHGLVSCGS